MTRIAIILSLCFLVSGLSLPSNSLRMNQVKKSLSGDDELYKYGSVIRFRHNIEAGTVLGAQDLVVKEMWRFNNPKGKDAFFRKEDVIGRTTKYRVTVLEYPGTDNLK